MKTNLTKNGSHCIIICAGADQPAIDHVPKLIKAYKKHSYIGVDNGCLALLDHHLPLDYAIGDFDSVTPDEFQRIKAEAGQISISPSEKDDTDMELALETAVKINDRATFYILGAIGARVGRLDHLIANLWLAYQPRYRAVLDSLVFIEKNQRLAFYQPGEYEIPYDEKVQYLSFISLTPIKNLSLEGSKYELNKVNYDAPKANISNEFSVDKKPVKLSFTQGLMMVVWELAG